MSVGRKLRIKNQLTKSLSERVNVRRMHAVSRNCLECVALRAGLMDLLREFTQLSGKRVPRMRDMRIAIIFRGRSYFAFQVCLSG